VFRPDVVGVEVAGAGSHDVLAGERGIGGDAFVIVDDTTPRGQHRRLDAILDAELHEHGRDVVLDRARADVKALADLAVVAGDEQP